MASKKNLYEKFKRTSCQVCGKSAVMRADYDVLEVPAGQKADRESESGRRFVFGKKPRFGCPDHPVIRLCYNLDGTICPTLPEAYRVTRLGDSSLLLAPIALVQGHA